jgi:hypothetical protein
MFKKFDDRWQLGGKETQTWLVEVQAWESRQRKWDAGDDNPYRSWVKRTYFLL